MFGDKCRVHWMKRMVDAAKVDREILVIGGHFEGFLFRLFKDDEVADDIEQGPFVQHSIDEWFHLRLVPRIDGTPAVHAFPIHEPGIIAGDGAGFGKPAIADNEKGVGAEQGGNDLLVGLQLVKSCLDIGIFIGGVLSSITTSVNR
jgi:hypothetical protein